MEGAWRIVYRESAIGELETAFIKHPDLKGIILRRLEALERFPPEMWFEIRSQMGREVFTSDGQLVRISGEADPKTRTVWVHQVKVERG